MIAITFKIEEESNYINVDISELIDYVEDVIIGYNYKIEKKEENDVVFLPYRSMPLNNIEASYYINNGKLTLLQKQGLDIVSLTYSISYLWDLVVLSMLIFSGIFIDYVGFIFGAMYVLGFFYRVYKIRKYARNMFNDILEIVSTHSGVYFDGISPSNS